MKLFDNLQDNLLSAVKSTFGYPAVWNPTGGGPVKTATVLYKGPTEKEKLANVDYDTDHLTMEYNHSDFPGLHDAVKTNKREPITITIAGQEVDFLVLSVRKMHDGKTLEARIKFKSA
jgi:hypothetical protein